VTYAFGDEQYKLLMFALLQNCHSHYSLAFPPPAASAKADSRSILRFRAAIRRAPKSPPSVTCLFSVPLADLDRHLLTRGIHLLHQRSVKSVHRGIGVLAFVGLHQQAA
jgi:hypothetical protein